MSDRSSPHILNTSSNLLGFTFLVFSSIRGLGLAQGTFIDEVMSFCTVIFALSSFLSFASIRSNSDTRSKQYESIAEDIFLLGLLIIAIVALLVSFDIIVLKV